jgi:hypothetical protein
MRDETCVPVADTRATRDTTTNHKSANVEIQVRLGPNFIDA